jgi:hypothetical protein
MTMATTKKAAPAKSAVPAKKTPAPRKKAASKPAESESTIPKGKGAPGEFRGVKGNIKGGLK